MFTSRESLTASSFNTKKRKRPERKSLKQRKSITIIITTTKSIVTPINTLIKAMSIGLVMIMERKVMINLILLATAL